MTKLVKSMTGFGRSTLSIDSDGDSTTELIVELKSVNSRFVDLHFRLPSSVSQYEPLLGAKIREVLKRGRIDVSVIVEQGKSAAKELTLNDALFASQLKKLKQSLETVGELSEATVAAGISALLQRREFFEQSSTSVTLPEEQVVECFTKALDGLVGMREAEGQNLAQELITLLALLTETVAKIEIGVSGLKEELFARHSERIKELLADSTIDDSRVLAEAAFFADKADIREELSRLASHKEQFLEIIKGTSGGRKLEFLLQEMGREVNTIGSKSNKSEVSQYVVEAKSILEKLREQVLNIE